MATIEIHHVPEDVYLRLQARAEQAGLSVSDCALAELQRSLERPTRAELVKSLASRPVREFTSSPTAMIRANRDA